MDPVTHGIAGALIGKAFFAQRPSKAGRRCSPDANAASSSSTRPSTDALPFGGSSNSTARVTIFAVVLGAVFPDVDIFVDAFSHDPLGIARYHRGFTHSFIGLPIFALVLAWLTRVFFCWYAKRRTHEDWVTPSFAYLFLVYAVGIGSHILLDGLTSFGTRMLNPFSKDRVAWDFLFIIDFVFAALLLVPQLAAWVHERHDDEPKRGAAMWTFMTVLALGAWALARAARFSFSFGAVIIASGIFAALFLLPIRRRDGSILSRATWCRIGFVLACGYIVAAGIAHHAAILRERAFAAQNHIAAEKIGAMPMPVSLLQWNGLILTREGVYQSDISLSDLRPPEFHFFCNSPPNKYTSEAALFEPVRTYLWFARFPVMDFAVIGGQHIVEYRDLRFFTGSSRRSMPFMFYISFDSDGEMLNYGWIRVRLVIQARPPGG